jgi:formylglycine-generating enzyme required for sulfatase activity
MLGFVEIPEGPFLIGSDPKKDKLAYDNEYDDKRRQCELYLPRYYIARYPVTVAQFRAFVEDSGYQAEDEGSLQGLPNHPIVNVSCTRRSSTATG